MTFHDIQISWKGLARKLGSVTNHLYKKGEKGFHGVLTLGFRKNWNIQTFSSLGKRNSFWAQSYIAKPAGLLLGSCRHTNAEAQVNCDASIPIQVIDIHINMQPSELLSIGRFGVTDRHVSLDFGEALEHLLQVQSHVLPILHQPGPQAVEGFEAEYLVVLTFILGFMGLNICINYTSIGALTLLWLGWLPHHPRSPTYPDGSAQASFWHGLCPWTEQVPVAPVAKHQCVSHTQCVSLIGFQFDYDASHV